MHISLISVIPIFGEPPNITVTTDNSISTSWRHWSPTRDIGGGDIVYYKLQYQKEGTNEWVLATQLNANKGVRLFTHTLKALERMTAYRYYINGVLTFRTSYHHVLKGVGGLTA